MEVEELHVLGHCAGLWAQVVIDLFAQLGVLKLGHPAVCSSSSGLWGDRGLAQSIAVRSSMTDKSHAKGPAEQAADATAEDSPG